MNTVKILISNEYLQALLVVIGAVVLAKVLHFILKEYVKKLTERTKSDIDNTILKIITKPLYIFVIVLGIWIGLRFLSRINSYLFWIDGFFFVFSVFIASLVISRILAILITRWLKVQERFEKTPQLIAKIVSSIIYIVAILIVLDHLNVEITPLIASLGLGGVAIALALQSTLSNLFAGLHIISDRPINIGDYIELEGGLSGYVEDIGWRSTRIRTRVNNFVIVPNSKLAEGIIVNLSTPQEETTIVVECGVSYESDLDKVERITIVVAGEIQENIKGAVKGFEPLFRYHTFGDSNINFSIYLRVEKPIDKFLVTHHFIKALKKRYDEEGIEISWPVRKIYYPKQDD